MQTAIITHGFADTGRFTTDRLIPYFEPYYKVIPYHYGFTELLGVRFLNSRRARALAELAKQNPFGIGCAHSNGCAILLEACNRHDAPFSQLVFINPALDSDFELSSSYVQRVHVWHSPHDLPVTIAKFFYKHVWGDAGRVGYQGSDPRIINYNKEDERYRIKSYTHLDMFLPEKLEYFAPRIIEALE